MNYWIYTAEKCHKTRSRIKIFMEKSTFFRQIDVFAKEVTTELISRIFQAWLRFMLLLHKYIQCGRTRNSLSRKFFSSNQLLSNFFSKTIAFTKFFRKSVRENFCNFHCGKTITRKNFPWNQLFSNFSSKTLIWRRKCWFYVIVFLSKNIESKFP